MSLRTQAQRMQQLGSDNRMATYGSTGIMQDSAGVTVNPPTFTCQYILARQDEQLAAFGVSTDIDLILRVPKTQTNFDATMGKNVVIRSANDDGSDLTVRLVKPHSHAFNPEWVFDCKAIW